MAKGEYCVRHDRWFGNILPCKLCEKERHEAWAAEHLRTVTYEEWKQAHAANSSSAL